MKKIFSIVIIILIFATYYIVCIKSSSKVETISGMAKLKSSHITKIVFCDGRGGNKPLTIENEEKIKEFIGYLDECIIKKEDIHIGAKGWIHSAAFYSNDKEVADITFGDPIIFRKTESTEYYDVLKNNLSTEMIDKFLQSVDSSWKSL